MKFTQYFLAMRRRADRAEIRDEWIQRAIDHPIKESLQADGRIRPRTRVAEMAREIFAGYNASRP